ncbi:DUF1707 domain-containing protein [Nocardia sp. NBC_01503]|uniref:DUF1707 SHOCT-like domain-containing protein n=1 Tax=Nocardia sp. NBC_01503 TaxID=2975997 RepID=UPI002E7BBB45|nr:DUF1707 domain-containing protein [Nocardia sp. NBC_01503]WTL31234.1 DUF1707 domain-containing protein [Nocardia sp. NBC_01503]
MTDFSPAAFGPAALRVGTAEREQAAEALGKHFAAGRLDVTEYDDRVARAYAAKTIGDLSVLFTDLPQPTAMRSAPPVQAAQRQSSSVWLPLAIFGVLALGAVLVVVTHMVPFFVFPLVFFLFLRGRRGYGPRYGGGRHYTRM